MMTTTHVPKNFLLISQSLNGILLHATQQNNLGQVTVIISTDLLPVFEQLQVKSANGTKPKVSQTNFGMLEKVPMPA